MLVPAPAPSPAGPAPAAAIVGTSSAASSPTARRASSRLASGASSPTSGAASVQTAASSSASAVVDDAATTASAGNTMGSAAGAAAATGSKGKGREAAVAQRMERKKTREKMRRQEVNDKFQELMDALVEVDSNGQEQVSKEEATSASSGGDKGNFRVDVLSRAVRVLRVRVLRWVGFVGG